MEMSLHAIIQAWLGMWHKQNRRNKHWEQKVENILNGGVIYPCFQDV